MEHVIRVDLYDIYRILGIDQNIDININKEILDLFKCFSIPENIDISEYLYKAINGIYAKIYNDNNFYLFNKISREKYNYIVYTLISYFNSIILKTFGSNVYKVNVTSVDYKNITISINIEIRE